MRLAGQGSGQETFPYSGCLGAPVQRALQGIYQEDRQERERVAQSPGAGGSVESADEAMDKSGATSASAEPNTRHFFCQALISLESYL